jgi:glycosyltransferase involved in cell wall biosynthesis
MKVLVYSHFFAPSVGGVETLVLSLARGLAGLREAGGKERFEITLVTQTAAEGFRDEILPFRVVRRPSVLQLRELIRANEVVHVAGPAIWPILMGFLERRPVIVEHHGFQTICPNGQLLIEPAGVPCPGHFMAGQHRECLRCNGRQGSRISLKLWLLTFVRRFLCRCVAANVAPTAWLGELVQLPRTTAIAHGLERSSGGVMRSGSTTASPLIAFQGRLVTTKGIEVLFEAARILSEQPRRFELVVIGDGSERRELERIASEPMLAGRVRFTGSLGGGEVEAILGEASVVVVPSLGGEVFGLVVAENMARGLPVIASDLGAFVEVMGGAGLTFRTGDARDLAAALGKILDDPELASQLGKRARERAAEFCDLTKMLEAHARIYQQARSRPVL